MSTAQQAADFIKAQEGFLSRAVWDVNAFRLGYGSDTITFPDGTYRNVVQGDTTTPEMATRDLARRIEKEFFPKVIKAVGLETWNKLPDNSKIALTSLAYNYGRVKSTIAQAAQTLNKQTLADTLVKSTYNDNQSQPENVREALRRRRRREADLILKGSEKKKC